MLKVKKSMLIIIGITFSASLFIGGKLIYSIFYTISGGLILSFIWFIIGSRKLCGFQKTSKNEYNAGETIEVKTYIDSKTMLPIPYVEVSDKTSFNVSLKEANKNLVFLSPYKRWVGLNTFQAKYRGSYNTGPIEINIKDIFGFFSMKRTIKSSEQFIVYPKVYELRNLRLSSTQAFGTLATKMKAFEDNTSISDIKKYNIGDNVKKIHWKLTAKRGELFVKNYELTGSAAAYVFLDFSSDCYKGEFKRDLEERAVEASGSIVNFLLKKHVGVNLYTNSAKLDQVSGRDIKELIKFMDIFCKVQTEGKTRIKDVIEKRVRLINKRASLIIITGVLKKDDIEFYFKLKDMGFDILLILVTDETDLKDEIDFVNKIGIKFFILNKDSNVLGVLEGYETAI